MRIVGFVPSKTRRHWRVSCRGGGGGDNGIILGVGLRMNPTGARVLASSTIILSAPPAPPSLTP